MAFEIVEIGAVGLLSSFLSTISGNNGSTGFQGVMIFSLNLATNLHE